MMPDIGKRLREKLWAVGEQLEEIRGSMRELKSERLQLRVTPSEKEEVDAVAELLGISVADYLMYLHRRAMKDLDRKIEREEHVRQRTGREREFTADDAKRVREGGRRERGARPPRRARRRNEGRDEDDEGTAGVGARLFD